MKTDLLAPQRCVICGRYACFDELPVCKYCLHIFNSIITEKCEKCGKSGLYCNCYKNDSIKYLFSYANEFFTHGLIYYVKCYFDVRFMDFLVEQMFYTLGIDPKNYNAVTFVPRKPLRKRRYGVDQAEQLARAIERRFGIPIIYTLERIGGRQQKTLPAKERFLNIKGRYRLRSDIPNKKYNRILLVDDLCTTGATVKACAKLLRESISREVGIIVIARK